MSGTGGPLSSEDVGYVIDGLVDDRQPVRLTEVAAELGVSPRTVQRAMAGDRDAFSRRHDESRLYVAAHGLVIKRASVREAGELAGFRTTSHFCAAFKARFGVSPGRFRAAALDNEPSTSEIASRMTREGLDLFEELLDDRGY